MVQGQDNVYHWDVSTSDYCFNELALKRTILLSTKLSSSSCRQNVACSRHYTAKIIASFALSSNYSIVHLRENSESQLVNITQLSLYVCHTSLSASRKYCHKPYLYHRTTTIGHYLYLRITTKGHYLYLRITTIGHYLYLRITTIGYYLYLRITTIGYYLYLGITAIGHYLYPRFTVIGHYLYL